MNNPLFKTELKEAAQNLLLKVIYAISSRKFWATICGILLVLQQSNQGVIDTPTTVWSIVSLIVAYSGLTVIEDVKRMEG